MRHTSPIVFVLFLVGCGGTSGGAPGANEAKITRADFGAEWPFTVEEGILARLPGDRVVFKADGKTYGVNGSARAEGYADLDEILASVPGAPGAKKNVGPVIERGLALGR